MAKSSMRGSAPSITKGKENMKAKKKKKNAKRLLRAPEVAAKKSVKLVKENPFENIWSRRKLDVMGKGRKGEGRRVGLARSRAVDKRKKTLLKDYERSRKSSMFVDKRIGENDGEMDEFHKGILRLQRERQLKLKKENKYNLPDGEEDDSGLQEAELFSDIDDFEDQVPLDDDDDDDADQAQKDFTASRHLNIQSMHNKLEADLQEGEDLHKTKKQVMEEIIAKSKFYKAHRAMEKEEDEHLVEQLDKNFSSLLQSTVFLSLGQKRGISDPADKASMQEQPDAYDKLVRVLPTDKRAHPTDRKKTAEEIAQEERERLESLEEERQKRMHGADESEEEEEEDDDGANEYFHKSPSTKSKHVSGDDLGDTFYINAELAQKTDHVDDDLGNRSGCSANDEDSKFCEDSEGDDDRGNNDDEKDDEEEGDTDGSFEDDLQNMSPAGDWEQSEDDVRTDKEETSNNSEAENKKYCDASCNKNQEITYLSNTRKDVCEKSVPLKKDPLPFVIEAPQNLLELCSLVDNRPDEEVVEAINRIRVCNAISLSAENRRKMQVFYGVLLQYFAILATRNPLKVQLINLLVKPLLEMSVDTPYFSAICARERLLHIRNQFCVDIKNAEKSSWPSLKTLLLLRLWSLTFPNSDFRHVVMTPATLLMCEYLMRCPIVTGQDTAIGSFLCSMLLSVAKQSLKFYPEAIRFLQLLLFSATDRPKSDKLNVLSFMDVRPVISWLFLNNQPSDVHPIDFFSIMSMPVDSPFFVSDNFRASVLVAVLETLQGFVNIYESLSSFPEIFLPISSLLHEVIKQDTTPEMLQRKMASLAEHIEKKANEFQMLRQPLQMRKQKPAPIKLLNPKFEENFVKGVDYDPDRERVERKKLKKLLKKEAKGAVRELRKDNYFLHEVKDKERLLLEEERSEMYGKARAFLQEQEHAYKSGQLGKGRKRRR